MDIQRHQACRIATYRCEPWRSKSGFGEGRRLGPRIPTVFANSSCLPYGPKRSRLETKLDAPLCQGPSLTQRGGHASRLLISFSSGISSSEPSQCAKKSVQKPSCKFAGTLMLAAVTCFYILQSA